MELGWLDSSSSIVSRLRFPGDSGIAFYRKNNIGFLLQIDKKDYDLPIYSFSELGIEMLSIIDDVEVNCEYLKEFANRITESDKSLHVTCGNLEENGDSYYFVKNERYFELPENKVDKSKE